MASLVEIARALYGVWRVLRFDRSAFGFFDLSPAGALRSFTAAAVVAPLYAMLMALRYEVAAGDASPGRYLLVQAIAYVIAWTLYPVLVESLSWFLGCRPRFPGYLCVYNWMMVLQNGVIITLAVLGDIRLLPDPILGLLGFFALVLTAGYLWYLARALLAVSGLTAAGLVVLDIVISVLINGTAEGLM